MGQNSAKSPQCDGTQHRSEAPPFPLSAPQNKLSASGFSLSCPHTHPPPNWGQNRLFWALPSAFPHLKAEPPRAPFPRTWGGGGHRFKWGFLRVSEVKSSPKRQFRARAATHGRRGLRPAAQRGPNAAASLPALPGRSRLSCCVTRR